MSSKERFVIESSSFKIKHGKLLESLQKPKTYGENQMLYQQGDMAEYVYYLKSGRVKIYIASQSGYDKALTTLTQGSLFGKASFFDGTPRTSSAKALEVCEIIAIDKQLMSKIFQMQPDFAIELLEYLSKTIQMLSAHIDWITFVQADKRIARFMCENYDPMVKTVAYTHEEIGEEIGVSRVTVSKILRQFRKYGWIDTKYRQINIKDLSALTEYADD